MWGQRFSKSSVRVHPQRPEKNTASPEPPKVHAMNWAQVPCKSSVPISVLSSTSLHVIETENCLEGIVKFYGTEKELWGPVVWSPTRRHLLPLGHGFVCYSFPFLSSLVCSTPRCPEYKYKDFLLLLLYGSRAANCSFTGSQQLMSKNLSTV